MKPTPRQFGAEGSRLSTLPIAWLLTLVLLSLSLQEFLNAQTRKPTEYEVKAAYLYNFGHFIKWPARALDDGFQICIYGNDPFGATLDSLVSGESIDGKRIRVRRVSTAREVSGCEILFLSSSAESTSESIIAAVRSLPVLTVSDMPGFINHGGMIQFVMQGERVRFQVNLPPADKSGLVVSSELLKVAVSVKRDSSGDD